MSKQDNVLHRTVTAAIAAAFLLLPGIAGPVRAGSNPPSVTGTADKTAAVSRVETLLQQVKSRVAPDERVSVFDVQVRQQGDVLTLTGRVLTRQQKEAVVRALRTPSGIREIRDEIAYFPYPEVGDHPYALARYTVIHLRAQPRNSAELVTEALLGSPVRVLDVQGEWIRVQLLDDGYIGWASSSNLVRLDETRVRSWNESRRLLITELRATLLDAPADGAPPIGYVLAATRLKYLDATGRFYRVELPNGKTAHVRSQEARITETTPDRDIPRILATARSFQGVPYLWGGTTGLMFDCSGFTQIVFRLHGYSLPRDADQQQAATRAVKTIAELQPGDLVFFDGAAHMGIYLGNGQVIHASASKGGVVINSLDPRSELYDSWLHRNFQGGGRVIQ